MVMRLQTMSGEEHGQLNVSTYQYGVDARVGRSKFRESGSERKVVLRH
jgi:hypothetical protein